MADKHAFGFDEFSSAFLIIGALNSPAELHGYLCGKFSGGARLGQDQWWAITAELMDFNDVPSESLKQALVHLYDATLNEFVSGDYTLTLLIPDDESTLEERIIGLSDWCRGFLEGFASAGFTENHMVSTEGSEALEDFAAITQADATGAKSSEAAESDFFQLTEYVRIVALDFFTEHNKELLTTQKIKLH